MLPIHPKSEESETPAITTNKINPEHDLVQLLTKEAVKAELESSLRDPILEAVKEQTSESIEAASEDDTAEASSGNDVPQAKQKSRLSKVIQGGTVFIVMFVVLYVTLRRLTADEAE
ncbi:hypothetical protein [Halorubrum sp. DTA98]|uniref:hypothetical protein n=1 Tax=Halorubrum sp. DTA98 TaxID=3402163 RepID=UPI003AB0BE96